MKLVVARVRGPCAVQDMGRQGHMHEGVPPGGALVPEWLARANAAVGNTRDAAGLELFGSLTVVAREASLRLAFDDGADGEVADVAAGEAREIPAPMATRVRYVAVRGGLHTPLLLGSRSTLAVAALGRWLRDGDELPLFPSNGVSSPEAASRRVLHARDSACPRVVPGPDLARFPPGAFERFVASAWTISPVSDRTGIRLQGPRVPRLDADSGVSAPMVRGAVQIPADGAPIVLGPDHPTVGGYPVLAVVVSSDWGTVAGVRTGGALRFAS